jgi:hypothetical protein
MTMVDPEFRMGEPIHFYDDNESGWRYGVIVRVRVKG